MTSCNPLTAELHEVKNTAALRRAEADLVILFRDAARQHPGQACRCGSRSGCLHGKQLLQTMETMKISLQPTVRQRLETAKEAWAKELLTRRFETNTNDLPRVKFETTAGDFVVELYENHAPETVNNFVSLVNKNFYNDLEFYHVKPGAYAQAGCPKNNGTADAGYRIANEASSEQRRSHFTGTLSMITDETDGTAGTQFRIMHQPNLAHDGTHTVFGRVIEGIDVVFKLKTVDHRKGPAGEATKIVKASILRKREREYKPTKVTRVPSDPGSAEAGG